MNEGMNEGMIEDEVIREGFSLTRGYLGPTVGIGVIKGRGGRKSRKNNGAALCPIVCDIWTVILINDSVLRWGIGEGMYEP